MRKRSSGAVPCSGSVESAVALRADAERHVYRSPHRYMYSETLGRWHTVDLLVGLAYLSHRETMAYAALDIANRGQVISMDQPVDKTKALLVRRSGRQIRVPHHACMHVIWISNGGTAALNTLGGLAWHLP